jgi:hypothetical protein
MRLDLTKTTLFGFSLRTLLIVAIAFSIGTVALALDLWNDGLVADLLWNLTGETEPLEQILGGAQYVSNFTRQTPQTDTYVPIDNLPDNPFGVNAFLELEAEPIKREWSMQLISEAGFGWLRQQFPWEDIEYLRKDYFWDLRNVNRDRNYDYVIDARDGNSVWQKYDHIVALAEQYDVQILARISGPSPSWALPPGTTNTHSPPTNIQDFVDFATVLATRYKGRITNYQIWNEPNLYPEWGDQLIDPAAYTELLCRTHDALKAVDPNIVIHTGAIGPTIDMSGRDAYDMLYLQRLYDFGAADCFDVLSVQGYGLFSGPTDRRMRPYTMNFARQQWLRDIMIANGDAHKPIWLSEAAWNPVPNDPNIAGIETYGQVTPEEAAEWAPLAYERAITEWPWVGVMNYWFLKRPNELESNQSQYYFRLVEPTWEPTPTYYSLQSYIQSGEWRHIDTSWQVRARQRLPQVLIAGLTVLFLGFVMTDACLKRLEKRGKLN